MCCPVALPFLWRFPPYSLLDSVFKAELTDAINEFFHTNNGSVDTFTTVWETFKVYIRGMAIKKHAGVLRSIRNRLELLETKLTKLEADFLDNTSHTQEQLKDTLEEYHSIADSKLKHMGRYAMAREYGEGDRPGSVLAALARRRSESSNISGLLDEEGTLLTEQADINSRFSRYYQELYRTNVIPTDRDILNYLEHIKVPWLTNDHREFLMRPFDLLEIHLALNSMRGQCPGTGWLNCHLL